MGKTTDWKITNFDLNKRLFRFVTRMKNTSTTQQTA